MKTRNGFVSNSSSTSFVVVFPKKLKFEDGDTQAAFEKLVADGQIFEYKNYAEYTLLSSALKKYTVASFAVGSDAGVIIVADKNKIFNILSYEMMAR